MHRLLQRGGPLQRHAVPHRHLNAPSLCSWSTGPDHGGEQHVECKNPHHEIQSILVDIGDKPESFIGSREWIGSFEVGYVLDELLNVTCKYMTLSQGRQLAEKGRELQRHFQTQGTPIMMGAGDFAFTVLGIDFNESTNQIAFMILARLSKKALESLSLYYYYNAANNKSRDCFLFLVYRIHTTLELIVMMPLPRPRFQCQATRRRILVGGEP